MSYTLQNGALSISYVPEAASLSVTLEGAPVTWSWANAPFIVLNDDSALTLTDGVCESAPIDRGTSRGVRAIYKNIPDAQGRITPYSVQTEVTLNTATGQLKAEACVLGEGMGEIKALAYPPRMKFDAPEGHGYTVLPRMQGAILPAGHGLKFPDGLVFERAAYIPVYGQIHDGCGYAAIIDTPYDARYSVVGEEIQPWFAPSLGVIGYPRALLYSFFPAGDFNTIAKIYRRYLSERGQPHETAAYACLVDWWCDTVRGTGVDLYIGLAPNRLGTPGWSQFELADQMCYNSAKPEVSGNVMFSYSKIFSPLNKIMASGVRNALGLWRF